MASASKSSKIECPVCFGPVLPPIYHYCRNGHLICSDCVERCNELCPTCRDPMLTADRKVRCLELEKVVRQQIHKCPNQGCEKSVKTNEYMQHKRNCPYRTAQFCSLLRVHRGCDVEIPLNVWIHHFRERHHENIDGMIGVVVSNDSLAVITWFDPEFRGSFPFVWWVRGRSSGIGGGEGEEFVLAIVETWGNDLVHWSPILLASRSFAANFVCDIIIHPGKPGHGPEVPMIHFKGVSLHCPEYGDRDWIAKEDHCTPVKRLKEVAEASRDRQSYQIDVRLCDKNQQEFYQFELPDHHNVAPEGNASSLENSVDTSAVTETDMRTD